MSLRAPRPIQRLSPRLLAENPFPPCRALAIGVDALYVFIFPAIPACGGLEGRTSLPSFPRTTSLPADPVRSDAGNVFFLRKPALPSPPCRGRGFRPYAMSLVPQRARGRSLRTTSPGQKALPRHRLLRRQELPPLPVNKTPRQALRLPCQDCSCPAEGKNALQGRDALPCRDKRPSLKASLVPLELFNLKRFT